MYIYGDRRDFGRIDVYVGGKYRCTTTWASSLKEAKDRFLEHHPEEIPETVEVQYADNDANKNTERKRKIRMWI